MGNNVKIVVALEVGTSKVVALVGEIRPDNTIKILGSGRSTSAGVRKGEIVDMKMATDCIFSALHDAELKADVEIHQVYLSVTGGHIRSFTNRGEAMVTGEESEVCEEDLQEVERDARNAPLRPQEQLIHLILQHYYIDGKAGVREPLGQLGTKIEADYCLVSGLELRLKNAVKCVAATSVEVEDVVFAPVAAAQAVLRPEDKRNGAVLIDIGGGVTEYVVYSNDAIMDAGALAVGGDHLTNDISIGLKVPLRAAERLKIEHGTVRSQDCDDERVFEFKGEMAYEQWDVHRGRLTTVMRSRTQEILEIVRQQMEAKGLAPFIRRGVFITGGGSRIRGLQELAAEVFQMPVHLDHGQGDPALRQVYDNPEYSVVVGMLYYAQKVELERRRLLESQPLGRLGRRVMDFIVALKSLLF